MTKAFWDANEYERSVREETERVSPQPHSAKEHGDDNAKKYNSKAKQTNGKAKDHNPDEGVTVDNFRAYMPTHSYIFEPSREMWPASSVNSRIEPITLCDANGNPLVDEKGRQKIIPASTLDRSEQISRANDMGTRAADADQGPFDF